MKTNQLKILKLVTLLLLIILAIIFAFQNLEAVNIYFFKLEMSLPLVFVLIATYVLGGLTWRMLISMLKWMKRKILKKEKVVVRNEDELVE